MVSSKIYLETSIWSRFGDPRTDEKRRVTEVFVRRVVAKHRIFVSMAVMGELAEIRDRKRARAIARHLWASGPEVLRSGTQEEIRAKALLTSGRWSRSHYEDMLHIAYTMLAGLDVLVT